MATDGIRTTVGYAWAMTVYGRIRWRPRWLDHRPHVVLEEDDPFRRIEISGRLQEAGYDVAGCPGPDVEDGRTCPLVNHGRCGLLEEADAVVCGLRLQLPECRAVLAALVGRDIPVIVETNEETLEPGIVPAPYDPEGDGLLATLNKVVRRS